MHTNYTHAKERNIRALKSLDQGNFLAAQELFRQNAKEFPGYKTWNNLGMYYYTQGRELKSGKVYNADRLGIHFLTNALAEKETAFILTNLGIVYDEVAQYGDRDDTTALKYLSLAFEVQPDFCHEYNKAACLFHYEKYEESCSILMRLNGVTNSDAKELSHELKIKVSLLYSILYAKGKKYFKAYIRDMELEKELELFDCFVLTYSCGEYEHARYFLNKILEETSSCPYAEMAADCCLRTDYKNRPEDLAVYLSCYAAESRYLLKKIIYNQEYRKKKIDGYIYHPRLYVPCGYYGCLVPEHHSPEF